MDDASEIWLLPSNGRFPANISYNTAPKAKMSERGSASLPSICSGDMYCTVPTMVPAVVSGLKGLRQAEVHQLGAALGQHDVAGFQIAMDNSLAMGHFQRLANFNSDLERFLQR